MSRFTAIRAAVVVSTWLACRGARGTRAATHRAIERAATKVTQMCFEDWYEGVGHGSQVDTRVVSRLGRRYKERVGCVLLCLSEKGVRVGGGSGVLNLHTLMVALQAVVH